MDDLEREALLGVDVEKLQLTQRQALVWALRAQGLSQVQIARRWGTSRANICNLERVAREHIEASRHTIAFDEQLRAPLHLVCHPGELLFDIPPKLYRSADASDIKVKYDGPMVVQHLLSEAPECVKDNRLTRPLLLMVSLEGQLYVRALTPSA